MLSVALLAPFAPPSVTGNAITVDRIAQGLAERGVVVRVWDCSVLAEHRVIAEVAAARPTLVHAFHAFRTGPLGERLARALGVPLVVTLTGTDANHDLFDSDRAATVRRVLEGAHAIIVFHSSIAARVTGTLPDAAAKLAVVPQAAALGDAPYTIDAHWRLPPSRVLFLVPGGIRPVKRPRLPLGALSRLVERRPSIRLAYAGPVIDDHEGELLARELVRRPWARHLGAVPHAQIASLMRQADVVLNCSESEGGMANAVIEAMLCERPVLASDIEGNRSLVEDGVTGLLFRDEAGLERAAERLVDDPALRVRLAAAGRARVLAECSPSREIDDHLAVYQRVAAASAHA
jgi:glycosyltransferase involved in cell wall biosynthesis